MSSLQLFVIFRRKRRTSAKCNFYYSNNRSVLVPSTCMFYAIVWGKDETKMLTARIVVGSFQRSALQMHGSYNVTVVQSPTSLPSPSQKKYPLSIITESQTALSDVIYLLPYFSHWISAFKCKTREVFTFEQITRSTPSEKMTS